jgi:hypothetical protein
VATRTRSYRPSGAFVGAIVGILLMVGLLPATATNDSVITSILVGFAIGGLAGAAVDRLALKSSRRHRSGAEPGAAADPGHGPQFH